jgi:hypothetical protein
MPDIQESVGLLCTVLVATSPSHTKIRKLALDLWLAFRAFPGKRLSGDQADRLSNAFARLFSREQKLGPAVKHEAAEAVCYALNFDTAAGHFRARLLSTCVPEKLAHQAVDSSDRLLQHRSAYTLTALSALASPAQCEVRHSPAAACLVARCWLPADVALMIACRHSRLWRCPLCSE